MLCWAGGVTRAWAETLQLGPMAETVILRTEAVPPGTEASVGRHVQGMASGPHHPSSLPPPEPGSLRCSPSATKGDDVISCKKLNLKKAKRKTSFTLKPDSSWWDFRKQGQEHGWAE